MHFSGGKTAPAYVSLIHVLLRSPLHSQNWLRSCSAPHGRTASHGSLHPPSKGAVGFENVLRPHFKRGLTGTVPTYPLAPAHMTSVPGSMHTLQASASLPTQQGRIGQTTGLCRDWHTTSRQGKGSGNAYCQDLGNKQSKTARPTH